jgi:hypothetical protein
MSCEIITLFKVASFIKKLPTSVFLWCRLLLLLLLLLQGLQSIMNLGRFYDCLLLVPFVGLHSLKNLLTVKPFYRVGLQPNTHPPNWRTIVCLFVWIITFVCLFIYLSIRNPLQDTDNSPSIQITNKYMQKHPSIKTMQWI